MSQQEILKGIKFVKPNDGFIEILEEKCTLQNK